jgi:hypothetical protein
MSTPSTAVRPIQSRRRQIFVHRKASSNGGEYTQNKRLQPVNADDAESKGVWDDMRKQAKEKKSGRFGLRNRGAAGEMTTTTQSQERRVIGVTLLDDAHSVKEEVHSRTITSGKPAATSNHNTIIRRSNAAPTDKNGGDSSVIQTRRDATHLDQEKIESNNWGRVFNALDTKKDIVTGKKKKKSKKGGFNFGFSTKNRTKATMEEDDASSSDSSIDSTELLSSLNCNDSQSHSLCVGVMDDMQITSINVEKGNEMQRRDSFDSLEKADTDERAPGSQYLSLYESSVPRSLPRSLMDAQKLGDAASPTHVSSMKKELHFGQPCSTESGKKEPALPESPSFADSPSLCRIQRHDSFTRLEDLRGEVASGKLLSWKDDSVSEIASMDAQNSILSAEDYSSSSLTQLLGEDVLIDDSYGSLKSALQTTKTAQPLAGQLGPNTAQAVPEESESTSNVMERLLLGEEFFLTNLTKNNAGKKNEWVVERLVKKDEDKSAVESTNEDGATEQPPLHKKGEDNSAVESTNEDETTTELTPLNEKDEDKQPAVEFTNEDEITATTTTIEQPPLYKKDELIKLAVESTNEDEKTAAAAAAEQPPLYKKDEPIKPVVESTNEDETTTTTTTEPPPLFKKDELIKPAADSTNEDETAAAAAEQPPLYKKDELIKPAVESTNEDGTTTEPETDDSDDSVDKRVRAIRFADEKGLPMEEVFYLGGPDDLTTLGCMVILLLSPEDRQFEFIQAEYLLYDGTTVSDLLQQMPGMATNESFINQRFTSLYRTIGENGCELINSLPLKDCDVPKTEVVVGVSQGHSGKEMIAFALPLLLNDRITKAVGTERQKTMKTTHTSN